MAFFFKILLDIGNAHVIVVIEQKNIKQGGLCMNIQKFTQKSIEAVNKCEQLAYEYGNQQIEQEHLLYSLLTIDDSLILKLL